MHKTKGGTLMSAEISASSVGRKHPGPELIFWVACVEFRVD